jgi:hypothetical protein
MARVKLSLTLAIPTTFSVSGTWPLALHRLEPVKGNADLMNVVVHTGAISGVAVIAANDDRLLTVGWDDKLNTSEGSVVQPNPTSLGAQPSAF